MTTITRTQLESLLPVSDCKDWTNPINDLLNSVNGELINVPQEYITNLQTNATFPQVHEVLELGILEVEYPKEALDFVRDLLINCEYKNNVWHNSEDTWCFELDEENKRFWFSYYKVYSVLVNKYDCNNLQISKLITSMVCDTLKLKGLTPCPQKYLWQFQVCDTLKLKGLTPYMPMQYTPNWCVIL